MRTTLIYLGRRGAGKQLTVQFSKHTKISAFIVANDLPPGRTSSNTTQVEIPNNIIKYIVKLFSHSRSLKKIILGIPRENKVLFPMINPFDFKALIYIYLLRQDLKTFVFIHDAVPHKGSFWPPKFVTRIIIRRSSGILTFSEYTSKKLQSLYVLKNKPKVFNLPDVFDTRNSSISTNTNGEYALIIGRIQKYKGIEDFLELYSTLTINKINLIVAGEGNLTRSIRSNSISFMNHWIPDETFVDLIKHCQFLILPYKEASQSGLIPTAIQLNKKILFYPVGGLSEQLRNYPNAYPFTRSSFVEDWNKCVRSVAISHPSLQPGWQKITDFLENFQ